mmetsp:Transcript_22796/g.40589  ORF Transcript_22796/g.40589 Transcript_22796/m.40589 type:complete len:115 (-) Transcript_22796:289-633(-)|eukprot:CAMPEP_0177771602 /NCGR_PEP_ID=MMETSP0491_2-20121128/11702_1 /TAXON_ID=63592 /ORGANISM="Tetraselmis chuii, Strain PLY429" /LENGTH=114 /DNA_ID=CAMNT_0019289207 /DNA_START=83 /DNA_END=427 /DNA_ORIENTATION=-
MGLASVQRLARAAAKPFHLHVQLTNKYSYARVLRMPGGELAAEASTREEALVAGLPTKSGKEGCAVVGKVLAERLSAAEGGELGWSSHIHVVRPPGKRFHGKFAEIVLNFKAGL